jgi:hypothetical protein
MAKIIHKDPYEASGPVYERLFVLVGMAAADNEANKDQLVENDTAYDNSTTSGEQNVTGNGFFATYRRALMPDATGTEGRLFNGVEARNNAHGSGKIDTNSYMNAESSYSNKTWVNGVYDENGEVIQDDEDATSVVEMKENGKMSYRPMITGIGSRYYHQHPIAFNALLKEEDWIKNRNGLNSLNLGVDQAHGLNEVLDAQSDGTNTQRIPINPK